MDELKSKKLLEEYFGDVLKDAPELMSECELLLLLVSLLPFPLLLPSFFGPSSLAVPLVSLLGLGMMRMYNLPADDLYFKWESFVLNQLKTTTKAVFNLENARELKQHIQREITSAKGTAASTAASSSTPSFKMSAGGSKRNSGMDL